MSMSYGEVRINLLDNRIMEGMTTLSLFHVKHCLDGPTGEVKKRVGYNDSILDKSFISLVK